MSQKNPISKNTHFQIPIYSCKLNKNLPTASQKPTMEDSKFLKENTTSYRFFRKTSVSVILIRSKDLKQS